MLGAAFPDGWLWLALVVALIVVARRERFLVTAVAVQMVFFVIAYLVSPRDLAWHIDTSWERLVRQVEAPALFAALVGISAILRRPPGKQFTVDG